METQTGNVIQEGQYVLLLADDAAKCRFIEAKPKAQTKIGKKMVNIEGVIGTPWESFFEIKEGKLARHESLPSVSVDLFGNVQFDQNVQEENEQDRPKDAEKADEFAESSTSSSSSSVFPKRPAPNQQKLSQEEINTLKEGGASGETIIKALIKGSVTFGEKTSFSKEKYVKKKTQKYCTLVCAQKPTAASICRSYYCKKPEKINYLRIDSLAQMMTLSNIYSGSQVLIVENCMGLVVGSVAERLGGSGRVINLFTGTQPTVASVDWFNFSTTTKDTIYHFPLHEINNVGQSLMQTDEEGTGISRKELVKQYILEGSDSLIIATKFDPTEIFFALFPYLALSRPFVVYSPYLQPLSELYHRIFETDSAINMELTETWMREYQILEHRTHPLMRMNGASGYLLSGLKVKPGLAVGKTSTVEITGNNGEEKEVGSPAKKQKTQADNNNNNL